MNIPSLDQVADAVVAAFPKLSEEEQRVSLSVYRLLAKGRPIDAREISKASGVSRESVGAMLDTWHGVERRPDGGVTAFWGLTLSETKHAFRFHGRVLHTWCAWDALFLPQLLGATAKVQSVCPVTGLQIRLIVDPSGVRSVEPEVALSFLLPTKDEIERSVSETFCCHVHFFGSQSAAINGFPHARARSSFRWKLPGKSA